MNIKSIPEVYQGLKQETSWLKNCIVEDVHGGYYMFSKPEDNHIIKTAVNKIWPNFEAFEKENKQTLLTYHANLFKKEPPKDQSLTETALWTWWKIISLAVDRTERTPVTSSGRVSNLLGRKYFLGESKDDSSIKTPQAKACLTLFKAGLAAKGTDAGEPGKVIRHITEEALKTYVIENAATLKTRQDPWRIFQYYRPNLLNAKLIRHD
jgi:hypothetical protein